MVNMLVLTVLSIVAGSSAVYWDGLRATWGPAPDESHFTKMPRTAIDAVAEGWIPVSTSCENNGAYSGFRYTKPNETAIYMMYDKNGIISGMQALLPHEEMMPTYRYDLVPMLQNETISGRPYLVLTAYFVPPESICSTGRSVFDLIEQGTGTGLWFQNGETSNSQLDIPLQRADATPQGWTNCECFPMMGLHNFFEVDTWQDTNCDRARPAHLTYNLNGELHGFVFQHHGNATSPRFEKPPNEALNLIVGPSRVPQCVFDVNTAYGISPIHVYMIDEPWTVQCTM